MSSSKSHRSDVNASDLLCPHTPTYVSSYSYACVLILLCMCSNALIYPASSYPLIPRGACFSQRHPHTTIHYYIDALIYLCPHTPVYVSSCSYIYSVFIPSYTEGCVLLAEASEYYYLSIFYCILQHMCPHTPIYVCICPHAPIYLASSYPLISRGACFSQRHPHATTIYLAFAYAYIHVSRCSSAAERREVRQTGFTCFTCC